MRKYYEAYDDRYRQIHNMDLQWSSEEPSRIVSEVMEAFAVSPRHRILEIGCGEGRDAFQLLDRGYDLLATDAAPEAVRFCRERRPEFAEHFQVLDCLAGRFDRKFDFIYAVAVIHMLVLDSDRDGFYAFIRDHLNDNGIALICTMGDGSIERQTDIRTAFDLVDRVHGQTGRTVKIAGTSCRMVSFASFTRELTENGLTILKHGITAVEPGFPQMMYAVVGIR